ncbi:hypothetical protein ADUPG1_000153 [Aduncisulcus paluster]|uniref:RING-type domain-containing protein n=1 Tax=Aduncisulcus paluster TaxID=2918883 RepID=A0ABQ5K591_9EUKA|nr:hypothetical protein ADUPG1_000153 [Aduncisulcus paluster]
MNTHHISIFTTEGRLAFPHHPLKCIACDNLGSLILECGCAICPQCAKYHRKSYESDSSTNPDSMKYTYYSCPKCSKTTLCHSKHFVDLKENCAAIPYVYGSLKRKDGAMLCTSSSSLQHATLTCDDGTVKSEFDSISPKNSTSLLSTGSNMSSLSPMESKSEDSPLISLKSKRIPPLPIYPKLLSQPLPKIPSSQPLWEFGCSVCSKSATMICLRCLKLFCSERSLCCWGGKGRLLHTLKQREDFRFNVEKEKEQLTKQKKKAKKRGELEPTPTMLSDSIPQFQSPCIPLVSLSESTTCTCPSPFVLSLLREKSLDKVPFGQKPLWEFGCSVCSKSATMICLRCLKLFCSERSLCCWGGKGRLLHTLKQREDFRFNVEKEKEQLTKQKKKAKKRGELEPTPTMLSDSIPQFQSPCIPLVSLSESTTCTCPSPFVLSLLREKSLDKVPFGQIGNDIIGLAQNEFGKVAALSVFTLLQSASTPVSPIIQFPLPESKVRGKAAVQLKERELRIAHDVKSIPQNHSLIPLEQFLYLKRWICVDHGKSTLFWDDVHKRRCCLRCVFDHDRKSSGGHIIGGGRSYDISEEKCGRERGKNGWESEEEEEKVEESRREDKITQGKDKPNQDGTHSHKKDADSTFKAPKRSERPDAIIVKVSGSDRTIGRPSHGSSQALFDKSKLISLMKPSASSVSSIEERISHLSTDIKKHCNELMEVLEVSNAKREENTLQCREALSSLSKSFSEARRYLDMMQDKAVESVLDSYQEQDLKLASCISTLSETKEGLDQRYLRARTLSDSSLSLQLSHISDEEVGIDALDDALGSKFSQIEAVLKGTKDLRCMPIVYNACDTTDALTLAAKDFIGEGKGK